MLARVLDFAISLRVCLSVCLSQAGIALKQLNGSSLVLAPREAKFRLRENFGYGTFTVVESHKARISRRRHRHRHPREDVGEDISDFPVQLAIGITSGNRLRVSDVSARILARMSVFVLVSVSASWNASLNERPSSRCC